MTVFDALIHAMTTIATGGFSSHDASIAYFSNPSIEAVAVVFMIVGSLPFVLYLRSIRGRSDVLFADTQVRWFFGILAFFVALAWIAYQTTPPEPIPTRFLTILFNVTSVMTGTGYTTTAYDNWSAMAVVLFFLIMFVRRLLRIDVMRDQGVPLPDHVPSAALPAALLDLPQGRVRRGI